MKKLYYLLAVATMAAGVVVAASTASAASPYVETIRASASSAPANNSSTITLTITSKRYRCSKMYPAPPAPAPYYVYPISDTSECSSVKSGYSSKAYNLSPAVLVPSKGRYTLSASGSGNTLSATTVTTNASGYATVTLRSSVAGAKTVKMISNIKGSVVVDSVTVNFTSVATTPSTAAPLPSTTPAPTVAAPAAPKVGEVTVSGAKADTRKPITIPSDKPLVLSGKTVPNGIVTLTIHSTPRTVTTKADKNGNWTYTVANLETGNHYVEAKVTDPKTKKTSKLAKLLSFSVTAAKTPATTAVQADAKQNNRTAIIVIGAVAVLAVAGVVGWYVRQNIRAKRGLSA